MIRKIFFRLMPLFAFLGGSVYAVYFFKTPKEFDPFDGEYTFHRNMKYQKYDTITNDFRLEALRRDNTMYIRHDTTFVGITKPFFLLQKHENQMTHYYLVECEKVIQKGFQFSIDTTLITSVEIEKMIYEKNYLSETVLKNPKRMQKIRNILTFYQLDTIFIDNNSDTGHTWVIGVFNYKGKKIEKKLYWYINPLHSDDTTDQRILGLGYDTDIKKYKIDQDKSAFERLMDLFSGTCQEGIPSGVVY